VSAHSHPANMAACRLRIAWFSEFWLELLMQLPGELPDQSISR
jgi:hypothetical protein